MNRPHSARIQIAAILFIGVVPAEFNWAYNPVRANTPWAFWCVDIARFVLLPAILLFWGIDRGLFTTTDLGLHRQIRGRTSPGLFVATMVMVPALLCAIDPYVHQFATRFYVPNPGQQIFSYTQVLPPPGPETGLLRFLAVVYMSITPGFTEEFYFRGLTRRLFRGGAAQSALYVILSSLLFSSVHIYGGFPHGEWNGDAARGMERGRS